MNTEGILRFIENYGMLAVFVSVMLEYACFPVPSEIVLPFAGAYAAFYGVPFLWVFALSVAAGLCGCLICYAIGRLGGTALLQRLGRRFHGVAEGLEASQRWFGRYGGVSVLAGRVLPLCRTYISFVAGISKQPLPVFLLYSAGGIAVWNLVLTGLGFRLAGSWAEIAVWAQKYSVVLLPVAAVIVFAVVCRIRRGIKRGKMKNGE